jgi:hypothetical protein
MWHRVALFTMAACLIAAPAAAWWEYGHHSVARIGWIAAKPSTRAAMTRLLAQADRLDTPECPAGTIEDAAYWPDCIHRYRDRFSYTRPWHYQNVDVCKPFDQEAACKDGNCVSAQIERNAKLLGDDKLPARERLMALAFLAHFVGDLHMPLHAGDRGDKGGNDFAVSYGIIAGRTNLHLAWDGYVAERGISEPPGGADAILAALGMEARGALAAGSVEDWARESWEASRRWAYGTMPGGPCGPKPERRPVIEEATVRKLVPVVRLQIARGGLRLARLLDEALG